MFLVSIAVVMLLVVVTFSGFKLQQKLDQQKELALQEQIEAEEERAKEIEEYEKYTQTKKYIEEVARDKLGLVYEGEILFKDEK